MTPASLMLITAIIWVVLFAAAIVNFLFAGRKLMEVDIDGFGKNFAGHAIIGGLLTLDTLAFLGALGWFLLVKFG